MESNEFKEKLYKYRKIFYELKTEFIDNKYKTKDLKTFTDLLQPKFKGNIENSLKTISFEEGIKILKQALIESLAYKNRLLNEDQSIELTNDFFSSFVNPIVFTNYFEKNSWHSVTDYTFDFIIGCIDEDKVGYILIVDED
jgi:hypothetical protein